MVVLSGVSDGLVVQDGGTKRRYGVVQEEVGEEDLEEHEVTLLPGPPTRSLYWSRDNILRSILSHSALEQSLTTSILVLAFFVDIFVLTLECFCTAGYRGGGAVPARVQ